MDAIAIIPYAIVATYLAVIFVYCLMMLRKDKIRYDCEAPVSILIAARNEEYNIGPCLQSLLLTDFPAEKMEILVGDDGSTDRTAEIVRSFAEKDERIRLVPVKEGFEGLRGKQNVLAQLALKASHEKLLVTDADILVPAEWPAVASAALNEAPVYSGSTVIRGKGIFAGMQALDWLFGMSIAKAHADLGIPITSVGNNMAFRRKEYRQVGGYENIPFSITEDYKLFKVMVEEQGMDYKWFFHPSVTNITHPVTFQSYMQQRKRWFKGGADIRWYNKLLLFFNTLVIPVLILSFFILPWPEALFLTASRFAADFIFLLIASTRIKQKSLLLFFPPYVLYYILASLILPVNQILPGKVNWKGRQY